MRETTLLLLVLVLLAPAAHAQSVPLRDGIVTVVADPSGVCTTASAPVQFNELNGRFFVCSGGTWTQKAPEGAAGAPVGSAYIVSATDVSLTNEQLLSGTTGVAVTIVTGDDGTATVSLDYTATLAANLGYASETCVFTKDGSGGGGFLCEGTAGGNSNEQLYLFPAIDTESTYFLVVDGTQVTDLEGDNLSITAGVLNAAIGTRISDLGNVSGGDDNAVSLFEQGQIWDWQSGAVTAAVLDGLALEYTFSPSSVDSGQQTILRLTNVDNSVDRTGQTDTLLELEALDGNDTVGAAISVRAVAGGLTTALDANDADIVNVIAHAGGLVTSSDLDIIDDGQIDAVDVAADVATQAEIEAQDECSEITGCVVGATDDQTAASLVQPTIRQVQRSRRPMRARTSRRGRSWPTTRVAQLARPRSQPAV